MRLDHDRCSSCFLTAETAQPLCQQQTDLSLSTCLPLSYSNLPLHRFWFGSVGSDEKFSSVASTPPPTPSEPPKTQLKNIHVKNSQSMGALPPLSPRSCRDAGRSGTQARHCRWHQRRGDLQECLESPARPRDGTLLDQGCFLACLCKA